MKPFFHLDQFFHFAFEQFGNGNARPFANDLGDVFFGHFFVENHAFALQVAQFGFAVSQLAFQRVELPILQFGGAIVIVLALRLLNVQFGFFDFFLDLRHVVDHIALTAQLGFKRRLLFFQVRQIALQAFEPFF